MPLLDATFFIDGEKAPEETADVLRTLTAWAATRRDPIAVSYAVALEVAAGAADPEGRLAEMERAFELVPFTHADLVEAARLAHGAIATGRKPRWHDIQTAAIARLRGTFVVSRNARDFKALGCKAWHYTKEPAPPR